MIRLPRRVGRPLVVAIASVLLGTGLASAAIPDPTGAYFGCYAIFAAAQGEPSILDWGAACEGASNECDLGPRSTPTDITVRFRLP